MDVVYLDLSKVFNTMPHYILLSMLWYYGPSGWISRWIRN